eukprot:5636547-Alexandrium_andersonii.AAC.1
MALRSSGGYAAAAAARPLTGAACLRAPARLRPSASRMGPAALIRRVECRTGCLSPAASGATARAGADAPRRSPPARPQAAGLRMAPATSAPGGCSRKKRRPPAS